MVSVDGQFTIKSAFLSSQDLQEREMTQNHDTDADAAHLKNAMDTALFKAVAINVLKAFRKVAAHPSQASTFVLT